MIWAFERKREIETLRGFSFFLFLLSWKEKIGDLEPFNKKEERRFNPKK